CFPTIPEPTSRTRNGRGRPRKSRPKPVSIFAAVGLASLSRLQPVFRRLSFCHYRTANAPDAELLPGLRIVRIRVPTRPNWPRTGDSFIRCWTLRRYPCRLNGSPKTASSNDKRQLSRRCFPRNIDDRGHH